ncbi:unnamed protein product [Didymodactylos carnosus]|uniref:Vacuolar ATPase assembly integral membrane protein VMA21 homolog n=1 Tax=Didymodactylos carnosus TaxID=1234261 RepID=A0A814GUL4_9BILA|nr:unnamed protein product [Didymodactylos carnosus]CAF1000937.1 unnamed protein product [Didymodactylos carnosus]CAF3587687.1 unnamed protein product [Didymodactylos carnosus]CAF3772399.1 unnamed protein product [Didymodactylos carnosus]
MQSSIQSLINQDEDDADALSWSVFRKMLVFILLLIVAPLGSYYASKQLLFDGFFEMSNSNSDYYAVFVTVVVIHILLIGFFILAFRGSPKKKLH